MDALIEDELCSLLGIDESQGKMLLGSVRGMGNSVEIRSYLGSLLPPGDSRSDALIGKVLRLQGHQVPAGNVGTKKKGKSGSKKDGTAKAPVGKKKVGSLPSPSSQKAHGQINAPVLMPQTSSARIVTGNENTKGPLDVENCLDCGLIYEKAEYAKLSRCVFCNEPLGRGQAKKKAKQLSQNDKDEGYEKAMAHRNKLLAFDATSSERNKVWDDQEDYFSQVFAVDSKWDSERDRSQKEAVAEAAWAAEQEAGSKIQLSFDLAGRQVVHDGSLDSAASSVYQKLTQMLS